MCGQKAREKSLSPKSVSFLQISIYRDQDFQNSAM